MVHHYIIAGLIGYLLGCSNLAWFIAKAKNIDLSSKGSGNPGTSNAVILMGWKIGVCCFLIRLMLQKLLVLRPFWAIFSLSI